MNDILKYTAIGGVALAAVIGVLYIKNKAKDSSFKPLEKPRILAILKQIRKDSYPIYKRLVQMHMQISQQFKGISAAEFKQIIEGPGSPMNLKERIDEITSKACEENGTSTAEFEESIQFYGTDREVLAKRQGLEREFQMALSGRVNEQVTGDVPELSREKLLEIQNKLVKEKYLIQVELLRKMTGKTEADFESNPNLLSDVKVYEHEEERILAEEGLGGFEDPSSAVFSVAVKRYAAKNTAFRAQFAGIEMKYAQIMQKYMPALQRSQDPSIFDNIEQEIIWTS